MRNANRYICVCRIGEIRRNGKLVLPLPVGVALLQFTIYNCSFCNMWYCYFYNLQFTIRIGAAWTFVSARLNRSVWGKGAGP